MASSSPYPTLKLNSGYDIPLVGLGTFLSKNEQAMTDLLRAAFDNGYRHIDTAVLYDNHKMIGGALKTIFAEGKYKREDIFITTKLFPFNNLNAIKVLQESLEDLQTTYVDLYLVHWPFVPCGKELTIQNKPQHVIWPELEKTVDLKLARSIGVSNYNVQSIVNILSLARIKPAVNQVELHVYLQQPRLVEACSKFGIAVTAYSPLARGGADVKLQLGHKLDLFNEPSLVEIGKKYSKSVAQVALKFLVSKGIVVIPKTENTGRLKENIDFFDFQLSAEEVEQISKLDRGLRTIDIQTREQWGNIDIFA